MSNVSSLQEGKKANIFEEDGTYRKSPVLVLEKYHDHFIVRYTDKSIHLVHSNNVHSWTGVVVQTPTLNKYRKNAEDKIKKLKAEPTQSRRN